MNHIPIPTIAHEEAVLPNQGFFAWIKSHTTLFISQIVAILGFISLPASTTYYLRMSAEKSPEWDLLKPERITVLVDYAHILFIVIAIMALIRVLNDNERGSYRVGLVYRRVFNPDLPEKHEDWPDELKDRLKTSKVRLRKFKLYFLAFWLSMFCLYVSFAFQHTYKLVNSENGTAASPKLSSINAEKSYEVWSNGCQIDETHGGDCQEEQVDTDSPLHGRDLAWGMGFPFLTFFLNNLSILFIFWCYAVLYVPLRDEESKEKHRRFQRRSIYVVVTLTALFPAILWIGNPELTATGRSYYVALFDALSGTLNAIIFALLIARLDSKLIGLKSWLICILYSYAAVQPLFVVFAQDTEVFKRIMTSVLIFVFVSKVYFFLIIIYALQTGRMLNYLFGYPVLIDKVDKAHRAVNARLAEKADKLRLTDKVDNPRLDENADNTGLNEKVDNARPAGSVSNRGWPFGMTSDVTGVCKVLGILSVLYFSVSLISYAGVLAGWNKFSQCLPQVILVLARKVFYPSNVVIDIGQLVFVLVAVCVLLWIRKDNQRGTHKALTVSKEIFSEAATPEKDLHDEPAEETNLPKELPNRATHQLRRFKVYFLWFWIVTFPLYGVLLWKHLELSNPLGHEPNGLRDMLRILWNPFFTFTLGTVNLLFVFWCFVVMQSPVYDTSSKTKEQLLFDRSEARQKLLIHYSAFVVVLVVAAFLLLFVPAGGSGFNENHLKDYATVFEGVTGTLSAVALSLLIARLDSKLIDLSPFLIYLLFAYAAIQPLLVVFEQSGGVFRAIETAVLTSAFLLKICFFLIAFHVLRNSDMLIYLVCFPFLHKRVDSIFENQFEIRISKEAEHSFSISIWKKNHLVYLPEGNHESRDICDIKVKRLRELMKDKGNYHSGLESGTHWLRVVDPQPVDPHLKEELLCESIALRSREDAEDLRDESIEKIPYCKYDRG